MRAMETVEVAYCAREHSPWVPKPKQGRVNYFLRNPELNNVLEDPKESYDTASEYPEIVATIQKSIKEQLATLPHVVQQAYSKTKQNLFNPWMPGESYPEFENTARLG